MGKFYSGIIEDLTLYARQLAWFRSIPVVKQEKSVASGDKQAELLANYADSRPGLEIFGSKAGQKLLAVDPKAKAQFIAAVQGEIEDLG